MALEVDLAELVELAEGGLQGKALDPGPVHGVLALEVDLLSEVLQVLVHLVLGLGTAARVGARACAGYLGRLPLLGALHPALVPAQDLPLVANLAKGVDEEVVVPLGALREPGKVLPQVALRAPLEKDEAAVGLQAQDVPHPAVVHVPLQVEPAHRGLVVLLPGLPAPRALPLHVILAETRVLVVLKLLLGPCRVAHGLAHRPAHVLKPPAAGALGEHELGPEAADALDLLVADAGHCAGPLGLALAGLLLLLLLLLVGGGLLLALGALLLLPPVPPDLLLLKPRQAVLGEEEHVPGALVAQKVGLELDVVRLCRFHRLPEDGLVHGKEVVLRVVYRALGAEVLLPGLGAQACLAAPEDGAMGR